MKPPKARKMPSGKWRCEAYAHGVKRSFTRDTKKDAEDAALLFKLHYSPEEADRDQLLKTVTLSEAIDHYIEKRSRSLSPATIRSYRSIQRNRFQGIMDVPLKKIKDWQAILNAEANEPAIRRIKAKEEDQEDTIIELDHTLSPKTLHNIWGLVKAVLEDYKINVDKISLPKVIRKEHSFLEPDEIKQFLNIINGHRHELPFLLCLHGLRRSEMMALEKNNIQTLKTGRRVINVSGAVVYDEHGKLVQKKENKTELSTRKVPIMIPRLNVLLNQAPDGKLCTVNIGALYLPLVHLLNKNGMPEMGLHGLRHSFASLCYHLQIPELVTQRWGGWSNPDTVHRIYTHLSKKDEMDALDKMEDFYADFV